MTCFPRPASPDWDWLVVVASDSAFTAGGWLLILMGYLAAVAFIGFYYELRHARPPGR